MVYRAVSRSHSYSTEPPSLRHSLSIFICIQCLKKNQSLALGAFLNVLFPPFHGSLFFSFTNHPFSEVSLLGSSFYSLHALAYLSSLSSGFLLPSTWLCLSIVSFTDRFSPRCFPYSDLPLVLKLIFAGIPINCFFEVYMCLPFLPGPPAPWG